MTPETFDNGRETIPRSRVFIHNTENKELRDSDKIISIFPAFIGY
jgi:hypothetical protein